MKRSVLRHSSPLFHFLICVLCFASGCREDVVCPPLDPNGPAWAPYEQDFVLTFTDSTGKTLEVDITTVEWNGCYVQQCFNGDDDCRCEASVSNRGNFRDTALSFILNYNESNDQRDDTPTDVEVTAVVGGTPLQLDLSGTTFNSNLDTLLPTYSFNSINFENVYVLQFDSTRWSPNRPFPDIRRIYVNRQNGIIQFTSATSGDWKLSP